MALTLREQTFIETAAFVDTLPQQGSMYSLGTRHRAPEQLPDIIHGQRVASGRVRCTLRGFSVPVAKIPVKDVAETSVVLKVKLSHLRPQLRGHSEVTHRPVRVCGGDHGPIGDRARPPDLRPIHRDGTNLWR